MVKLRAKHLIAKLSDSDYVIANKVITVKKCRRVPDKNRANLLSRESETAKQETK